MSAIKGMQVSDNLQAKQFVWLISTRLEFELTFIYAGRKIKFNMQHFVINLFSVLVELEK